MYVKPNQHQVQMIRANSFYESFVKQSLVLVLTVFCIAKRNIFLCENNYYIIFSALVPFILLYGFLPYFKTFTNGLRTPPKSSQKCFKFIVEICVKILKFHFKHSKIISNLQFSFILKRIIENLY